MSVGRAFSVAILPALWPSLPMVLLVLLYASFFANGIPALAIQAILAVLSYCLIFFGLALGREERGWYLRNVKQFIRRPHAGALSNTRNGFDLSSEYVCVLLSLWPVVALSVCGQA